MKILAIDTSGQSVSVAVTDGRVMGESFLNNGLTHSQTLMRMIDYTLDGCSLSPRDIDGFAVTIGPGSFTGLRIGVGAIKGMAGSRPCYAVNTLDVLACGVRYHTGPICAMLDARNSEVYTAVYSKDRRTSDYIACNIDAVLRGMFDETLFVGDGATAHIDAIIQKYPHAVLPPNNLMLPRASTAGLMTTMLEPITASELQPLYLKQSSAERNFKK